jgi:hypothetical protein
VVPETTLTFLETFQLAHGVVHLGIHHLPRFPSPSICCRSSFLSFFLSTRGVFWLVSVVVVFWFSIASVCLDNFLTFFDLGVLFFLSGIQLFCVVCEGILFCLVPLVVLVA